MDTAYVYDASIYCEDCAPAGAESVCGSNECDSPEHCSECHKPLEHSLTRDGVQYVLDSMRDSLRSGHEKYLTVHKCYDGTYYENVPHVMIVRDWAEKLHWYGLGGKDGRFVVRFLSWTQHMIDTKLPK